MLSCQELGILKAEAVMLRFKYFICYRKIQREYLKKKNRDRKQSLKYIQHPRLQLCQDDLFIKEKKFLI